LSEAIIAQACAIRKGEVGGKVDEAFKYRAMSGCGISPSDVDQMENLAKRKLVRLFTSSTFTG
jgi:hypothetical protein